MLMLVMIVRAIYDKEIIIAKIMIDNDYAPGMYVGANMLYTFSKKLVKNTPRNKHGTLWGNIKRSMTLGVIFKPVSENKTSKVNT
jgi:hypothetical protein